MALIGIGISSEIAKKLANIKIPGEKVDPESMHITMFYLGDENSPKKLVSAFLAMADIIRQTKSFKVSCSEISSFPKGEDGYPVILKVESEELMNLRAKIKKSFDAKGVKYSNKFPEYKPHITLGYSKKEPKPEKINKTNIQVNHIMIWGGYNQIDGVNIQIPLKNRKMSEAGETFDRLEMVSEIFWKVASVILK